MLLSSALLSLAILPTLITTAASPPLHTTYNRNITILGAGASGTYAAVRLRSAYNASILLLEQADHTGGHVNTYLDPLSGQPVDYGVQRYWDQKPTREFFAQFNVSVAPAPQPAGLRSVFVDFYTGKELEGYGPPTREAEMKAAGRWRDVAGRYDEVLVPGFWMLDGAMPEELVRPFGEFVEREGVEDLVPLMNTIQAVSVGDVWSEPLFYVMGLAFPSYAATGLLEGSEIAPSSGSNSELYNKTAAWLGSDLLLNTRILEIRRPPYSCSCSSSSSASDKEEQEPTCTTTLLIQDTLTNQTSLIHTNHLLITAQPSPNLLSLLSLSPHEASILNPASFPTRDWYVGLIHSTVLRRNVTYHFFSPSAAPNRYLDLFDGLRYDFKVISTGPEESGLFRVQLQVRGGYGFQRVGMEETKRVVSGLVERLVRAGTEVDDDAGGEVFEWRAFVNHNGVRWGATAQELREGFVEKLYGLQGERGLWWTGSTWCADYSSSVWAFTDTVLERMMRRGLSV